MKRIFALLLLAVTVMVSTASAATKGISTPSRNDIQTVASQVPANLTIRQDITLTDGTALTVYYVKEGNQCALYSEQSLKGYGLSDILRVKKTNFERVNYHKGTLQMKQSAGQVLSFIRKMAKMI